METMLKCPGCGEWVRSTSGSDCTCPHKMDYAQLVKNQEWDRASEERQREVEKEYGRGARVVTPYNPNRKQRRAQEARLRKNLKKKGKK